MKKMLCLILITAVFASCAEPANVVPSAEPTADKRPVSGFSLNEKYERWYEEPVREFRPSADYGAIYPFIGSVSTFDMENGLWDRSFYGFATADGKIVCDAVFSYVSVSSIPGGEDFVYIAERVLGREGVTEKLVIAPDGSFASAYENVSWNWASEDEYISVKIDGKWGVIDINGNEILKAEYASPSIYGDGLFVTVRDINKGYIYVDKAGKTVLGPYKLYLNNWSNWMFDDETGELLGNEAISEMKYQLQCLAFSDGLAPQTVSADNRTDTNLAVYTYRYIDKTGAVAIPTEFASYSPSGEAFADGRAIVRNGDDYAVIDTHGSFIIPWTASSVSYSRSYQSSDSFFITGNSVIGYKYYDRDGRLLHESGEYGDYPPREPIPPDKPNPYETYTTYNEFGDYAAVRRGHYGGLIDKNGEWIVKVSLLDYLDD